MLPVWIVNLEFWERFTVWVGVVAIKAPAVSMGFRGSDYDSSRGRLRLSKCLKLPACYTRSLNLTNQDTQNHRNIRHGRFGLGSLVHMPNLTWNGHGTCESRRSTHLTWNGGTHGKTICIRIPYTTCKVGTTSGTRVCEEVTVWKSPLDSPFPRSRQRRRDLFTRMFKGVH